MRIQQSGRARSVALITATTALAAAALFVLRPSERASPTARVRGVLVDPTGAPLAGARVGYEGGGAAARTDARGAFALEVRELGGNLTVLDERLATVRASAAAPGDTTKAHVVVAAPALDSSGRLLDPHGEGVAGTVYLALESPATRLPEGADPLAGAVASAESGLDGRFSARWPSLPDAKVFANARGFLPSYAGRLRDAAQPFDIPIRRTESGRDLHGYVRRADGTPAAGARVGLAGHGATSDETGLFVLELTDPDGILADSPLYAILPGFEPAVRAGFGGTLDLAALPREPIELVLGRPAPALDLRGVVHQDDGRRAVGWRVDIEDSTLIDPRHEHSRVEGVPWEDAPRTWTRGDGSFELEGLLARDYRLIVSRGTLKHVTEPISAGTREAVMTIDTDALVPCFRGRVLDPEGLGIAGIVVTLCRLEGSVCHHPDTHEDGSVTDMDGRFELSNVPRQHARLVFEGPSILPFSADVAPAPRGEYRRFETPRLGRIAVKLQGVPAGPSYRFRLEGEGDSWGPLVYDGGKFVPRHREQHGELDTGRRDVEAYFNVWTYRAPVGEWNAVLVRGDAEVARRRVVLSPGALTHVVF